MKILPILSVALLFCVSSREALVQTTRDGNSHASVAAYPEAVVTATDPASGITLSIDPDGTGLTANDAAGKRLWHVDAVKEAGHPHEGSAVVRYVAIAPGGKASLVIGKNRYAEADIKTGKVRFLGED